MLNVYGHLDAINFLEYGKDKILDVMIFAEIELVKSLIRTWTHDNTMPTSKKTDTNLHPHYRFLKDITQQVKGESEDSDQLEVIVFILDFKIN